MANTKIIDSQMFGDRLRDAFTKKLESNVDIKIDDKTFGNSDQRREIARKKAKRAITGKTTRGQNYELSRLRQTFEVGELSAVRDILVSSKMP